MILSSSSFVLKEKLQKKLLFCSCEVQRGHFIDKMIVPINVMLKTNTEILNQTYRHKGFYNSNPAFPFRAFIIKYPVIVSIKSKTDPLTNIQPFFNPPLPSATKG